MAKNIKEEAKTDEITSEDLIRVLNEIDRQKKHASEYAGLAGKATQNAVERYGLEKNALTMTRKLKGFEDGKRQSVLRAFIKYNWLAGHFKQIDMHDDLIDLLEEIVEEARSRGHNSAKAEGEVLTNLIQ